MRVRCRIKEVWLWKMNMCVCIRNLVGRLVLVFFRSGILISVVGVVVVGVVFFWKKLHVDDGDGVF